MSNFWSLLRSPESNAKPGDVSVDVTVWTDESVLVQRIAEPAAIWMFSGKLKRAMATSTNPVLPSGSDNGATEASLTRVVEVEALDACVVEPVLADVVVVADALSAFFDPHPVSNVRPTTRAARAAPRAMLVRVDRAEVANMS